MDSEKNIVEISTYMKQLLCRYSRIRGKENLDPKLFWDAVIISASDESQMKGYQRQISEKKIRKEIPPNIPFHVFADPPGYKIGCGGSALFVLDKVSLIYENALQDMRILFIPAGGYSQRLPNLTSLGKLFCPLPFGNDHYQMLDLILATYLSFLKDMPAGVFLASSDAIISFSLSENDKWTFSDGFTALAHPSPISVGCGHGVYVLPSTQNNNNSSVFVSECLRVLQKPSIEEMQEKGAVIKFQSGDGDKEIIFSDSTFFINHKIVAQLIKFYNSNKPLKHELSSYGDFLQPLGSNASPSYIVEKETNEELALLRSALYRNLYGTNLSVLALKNSFFHHLGSMKEYLDSFCFKNTFSRVFPVCHMSFSSWSVNRVKPLYVEGTVLHSVLHPMSYVPEDTIVEYSDISVVTDIGKNCIISNVQLSGLPVQRFPYSIPENTLIHTVAIQYGFVTIACSINDNIKKTFDDKYSFEVNYFGKLLTATLAPDLDAFVHSCDKFSLWNAKIFPVKDTPEDSVSETLKIILSESNDEMEYLYHNFDEECIRLVSMEDVLFFKDVDKMINYRQTLYHKIKLQKQIN